MASLYYFTFLKILSLSKLPDFPVANRGHGKSKSLIHVFSVARQEADLLVPLEPYKFPIKGQRFKEIIKKQLRICFNDIISINQHFD